MSTSSHTIEALSFLLHPRSGSARSLPFQASHLIIAGWAARDADAVRHHIDELSLLGVAAPSRTPLFYECSPSLLTHDQNIQVLGEHSSGEVEALLFSTREGLLVGVGSDHTDRRAEQWSVPHSKQLCGKPAAQVLWRFDEIEAHWDQLILKSWIPDSTGKWIVYQEGSVASLRHPRDLMSATGDLTDGTVLFCGTLASIGGIRPSSRFCIELHDPVLSRSIRHTYSVSSLPVIT